MKMEDIKSDKMVKETPKVSSVKPLKASQSLSQKFFFPEQGVSIEAETYEQALKILNKSSND